MKWTPWLLGPLTAVWIAGCGGERRNETGAAAGAGADTMQPGATGAVTDTGMRTTDTARTGARMHTDTNKANQTKSGVTDTRTGKSTLGEGVKKTRPDQGQPVVVKGDTLQSGGDSVPSSNR